MELRQALKEQYHAGLAMLSECVEKCTERLWLEGEHPRTFWRIAFHAAFFTHRYLGQNEAAFQPWPGLRREIHHALWRGTDDVGIVEHPSSEESIYRKSEILDYICFIEQLVDVTIDQLDFDSDNAGFPWYNGISKLSHELMNLRHLQGHIGQLSERLMANGIDTPWLSKIREYRAY